MQKRKNKRKARARRPGLLDRTPAIAELDAPLARVDAGALGPPVKRAAKKKRRKLKIGERHPTLAERSRKKPPPAARRGDPDEAMRRHAASISTDLRSGGMPTLRDRVQVEGFKTQLRGASYGSLRSGNRTTKKPEAKATSE